jgi:formylmethanofuran dehydrogenase subunit E
MENLRVIPTPNRYDSKALLRYEKCDVCTNRFVVQGNPVMNESLLCDYCWAKDWSMYA